MVTVERVVPGEVLSGLGVSGFATVVVTRWNGADVIATVDRNAASDHCSSGSERSTADQEDGFGFLANGTEREMSEKVTRSLRSWSAADAKPRNGKRTGEGGSLSLTRALLAVAATTILLAAAAPAAAYSVIHSHLSGPEYPVASLILDGSGNLYGTTYVGGTSNMGTVFSVKMDGTGFQLLHEFTGWTSDGIYPAASLILDGSGNLYGTTEYGGTSYVGTVFRVKTDGTGFQLLHEFTGGASDGRDPRASLILDGSGNLCGTTLLGGTLGVGTIFSVKTDGTGFQLLHTFVGGASDGSYPAASLILDGSGNLYGTTYYGGASNLGTVFSMKTDGTGFHLLHTFTGGASDGRNPRASLILDGAGNLYGTTWGGGTSDAGTIFSVKTDGTGFQLLHSFAGGASDGNYPAASLILDGSGYLFGTTEQGGASNFGTVFGVKTDGTGFQLLHSFAGGPSDGSYTFASLILDGSDLYGTTLQGGTSDAGTVFRVKKDGRGFQLLHSFTGGGSYAPLILDRAGSLYGTTVEFGPWIAGTVFSVKTDGTGFQVLLSLTGGNPYAPLILDGAGNLYGTTEQGGTSNVGTVFSVKTDGTGVQLLHSFTGGPSDGRYPQASLILDGSGNLYGTTYQGGSADQGTEFTLPSLCLPPPEPGDFTESSATICLGYIVQLGYTVPNDPSVTYIWSYSGTGATINGAGSAVGVAFSPSSTSGTLSVTATNACGTSPARSLAITLNPLPNQPGAFIVFSDTVSQGQVNVAYTVPNDPTVTYNSYNWSYSGTGATIVGTGNSVLVSFSSTATSGTLAVTLTNGCGMSAERSLAITVIPAIIAAGDFSGVGQSDILWSNGSTGQTTGAAPLSPTSGGSGSPEPGAFP